MECVSFSNEPPPSFVLLMCLSPPLSPPPPKKKTTTTDTRDRILFLTAGLVLLTILINGTTCKPLLHRLGGWVRFHVLFLFISD